MAKLTMMKGQMVVTATTETERRQIENLAYAGKEIVLSDQTKWEAPEGVIRIEWIATGTGGAGGGGSRRKKAAD